MNTIDLINKYYKYCPVCNIKCINSRSNIEYYCTASYFHFAYAVNRDDFKTINYIRISLKNYNFVYNYGIVRIYLTNNDYYAYGEDAIMCIKSDLENWALPKDELERKIEKCLLLI